MVPYHQSNKTTPLMINNEGFSSSGASSSGEENDAGEVGSGGPGENYSRTTPLTVGQIVDIPLSLGTRESPEGASSSSPPANDETTAASAAAAAPINPFHYDTQPALTILAALEGTVKFDPKGNDDGGENVPLGLSAGTSGRRDLLIVTTIILIITMTTLRYYPIQKWKCSIQEAVIRIRPNPVMKLLCSYFFKLVVAFPFIVAGCGMVGAGLVLDIVQHWRVFSEVSEIFILVPALLGLKGNLEMTLASRLSTMANLGKMDSKSEQNALVYSNLALIQVQAIVVAFLASAFAIILAWIPTGTVDWGHAILLCASSLTTASLASLILGVIMVIVVLGSRHFNINPDNVATPVAASLGDLTTLAVLAGFGSLSSIVRCICVLASAIEHSVYDVSARILIIGTLFLNAKTDAPWLNWLVVCGWLLVTPVWCCVAWKNPSTRNVMKTGWTPVIFAMLISSAGGFILKFAVERFHGIAVFQPVINGIGGNLVAVQASRISTSLHRSGKLGGRVPSSLPPPKFFQNPLTVYFSSDGVGRASRVLLLMVVPGHLIFMYMIHFLQAGHTTITLLFAIGYLTAALIQVSILLWICVGMVIWMWKQGNDPDNFAIPYLTALGDLLGTALLAVAFSILFYLGDRDADIGE